LEEKAIRHYACCTPASGRGRSKVVQTGRAVAHFPPTAASASKIGKTERTIRSDRAKALGQISTGDSDFDISFDNFRTMRRCRLIWREGDFVGAAFET
jgi:hypothetical protein